MHSAENVTLSRLLSCGANRDQRGSDKRAPFRRHIFSIAPHHSYLSALSLKPELAFTAWVATDCPRFFLGLGSCWCLLNDGPLSKPLSRTPPPQTPRCYVLLCPGERVAPTQDPFVAGGSALAATTTVSIFGAAAARGGGRYMSALGRARVVDRREHHKQKSPSSCVLSLLHVWCCAPRSVLSGPSSGRDGCMIMSLWCEVFM